MRWQKADGGEDNNSHSLDEAQIVGGGNNNHCVNEVQIDGGRGKVCKFFSKGGCNKGETCLFRHDIDQGICKKEVEENFVQKREIMNSQIDSQMDEEEEKEIDEGTGATEEEEIFESNVRSIVSR